MSDLFNTVESRVGFQRMHHCGGCGTADCRGLATSIADGTINILYMNQEEERTDTGKMIRFYGKLIVV